MESLASLKTSFQAFPSVSSKPKSWIPPTQLNASRKNSLFTFSVRAQVEPSDGSAAVATSGESVVDALKVKEWEVGMFHNEVAASQGIRIRRRPPTGPPSHYVGPFQFRLENEGNTPRNILEEIVWYKDKEVAQLKERKPLIVLKKALENAPPARDFIGALRAANDRTGLPGLIAEVKKASPSRGILREDFDPIHQWSQWWNLDYADRTSWCERLLLMNEFLIVLFIVYLFQLSFFSFLLFRSPKLCIGRISFISFRSVIHIFGL